MQHNAFISHASGDRPIAEAVCVALEAAGISCWIAPRDVTPGKEYAECLAEAIRLCPVMVVVLSRNANASIHVAKEVERAVNCRSRVIAFRVEDVLPTGALEYLLSSQHWFDAVRLPIAARAKALAPEVQSALDGTVVPPRDSPPENSPEALQSREVPPDDWEGKSRSKVFGFMRSLLSDQDR
ncbi:MAG: toll/interleukin-1 receptor domain-containing protein [Burkholderiales bacterium]